MGNVDRVALHAARDRLRNVYELALRVAEDGSPFVREEDSAEVFTIIHDALAVAGFLVTAQGERFSPELWDMVGTCVDALEERVSRVDESRGPVETWQ